MPPQIVRDSKYRHVFGEVSKEKFEDLRPSNKPSESAGLRANPNFIALGWESGGGGTIAVLPIDKPGRLKGDQPLITGHKGAVLDFEWNPFDDNMLISCSEDTTLKLWQIPEGGLKEHLKEPLMTLEGHGKKVQFCHWNKSVSNILASAAFDGTVKVWDVSEEANPYTVEVPDKPFCLKWNYTGSTLALTDGAKCLRLIDPRQQKVASEVKGGKDGPFHGGSKASKCEWMGSPSDTDQNFRLITTGFSSQAEREIAVWDIRSLDAPQTAMKVDTGTGSFFPIYDPGTGMTYFFAKGDAQVRYFEMDKEDPYFHFITNWSEKNPAKGFDFLPKRSMDVSTHTVMKGVKLEANSIMQVSFKVPRKSEAFQEDIFPDCPGMVPALSADKWQEGAECNGPRLQSMAPGADTPKAAKSSGPAILTMKEVKAQLAEAQKRIKELEDENAKLKEQLAAK